uniref:Transposase (Putative), gypsy type n=1 Tax=Tanacetum cinerariifolium TaxID=118510 RepID=A0A6L2NVV3_TANCI|nr:hypothetical protein [Tanacetum cinerariifolium]
MDIFAFITPDPTKVRIVERERNDGEARLLDTTIGRIVLLLPVDQDRADSELEASVERLFDEGGSGNQTEQGDSAGGEPNANIQLVVEASDIAVENMTPVQSRRQGKRKSVIVYASGASHPLKNLKKDHGDPEWNLRRWLKLILLSAGGTDPTTGVFSNHTGSDFLVGAIRTVINHDTDLQKVYVPHWSVMNGSRLDDGHVCREMVDEFAPLKFFTQDELSKLREEEIESLKARMLLREAEAAKAIRLHAEASNFETVEKLFRDETNALRERNVIAEKERNALDMKVTKLETSAMSKERELTDLNALVHKLEISSFELQEKITVYENCMDQLEEFQDDRMKVFNDKFDRLYTDFIEMALHLEEKFYPHLLTTISGRRWLLTHGIELAIANCLNSPKYLSALGAAIGKAIEKGMQDALAVGIIHGKEGMVLTYIAAYKPSAEADYMSALQQLENVNFSLLARLKSKKDASVETVMDILRLEGSLAKKLGLNELQPHIDQPMVPIHSSENISNQRSTLRDVFVPLAEPLSTAVLTGTKGTLDVAAATADITTTLYITFFSTSTIAPISIDDYEVMGEDDQAIADENVASFPNVDVAELNIP